MKGLLFVAAEMVSCNRRKTKFRGKKKGRGRSKGRWAVGGEEGSRPSSPREREP